MNDPSPQNPFSSPRWSSDEFREPSPGQNVSPLGRGLVGHVPIVAILLLVQGALEILFGLLSLGLFALFQFTPDKELANLKPLGLLMAAVSVPALLSGVFRLIAGYCNLRFRRRVLGMVALAGGLMTLVTGYCALTSIAIAIYGLVVYLNESVIAAFKMGDQDRKPSEIEAAFPRSR